MRNFVQVTQVTSNNCGGNGAWMDNPLNTPRPSDSDWTGFQLGGGRKRKMRKMRKTDAKDTTRTRTRKRQHRRVRPALLNKYSLSPLSQVNLIPL